jgi:hypothetical protein
MKELIEPSRLIGKPLYCRPAFPAASNNYIMKIDGLTAGRIIQMRSRYERIFWVWFFTGPSYLSEPPANGEAETLEVAARAFKRHFFNWLIWAQKQEALVTWHGVGSLTKGGSARQLEGSDHVDTHVP